MSSMLSDTCITSRAVSPRPLIQQHHLQHQAQHQQQQQHLYHHAFDDGGVVSTPSSFHFLGGPQSLAGSQHCAFNAALRLPLHVGILPSSSSSSSSLTYPIRGIPRAAFDPQVCSEQRPREQLHPLASNVSQPPPSQTAPQQDSSMRYSHLDLPILNAETYTDGYRFKELGSRQPTNSPSPPTDDGPTVTVKKRLRKNEKAVKQQQDEGEEEAKGRRKRARGRPRLEPPDDQTYGDRRRTQVRVAQRNFRSRKEAAITDLESQVRDLKEVNDEMKDVFQRLLESAHHQGISQAPGFGEHLRKVQALVERSREVGKEQQRQQQQRQQQQRQQQQDENDESLPDVEEMVEEGGRRRPSSQQARTMTSSSSMQGGNGAIAQARRNQQPEQLYGGLIVTHEPVVPQSHAAVDPTTYHSLSMSMHDHQHHAHNGNYQIIAAPTLENASFATNAATSSAPFLFTNNNASSSAAATSTAASQWTFAPWTTLPLPSSVAYQESAFARRLHRYATERAAYLVCLPDPPQDKMMRVFGFARLFETIEQIRERTLAVLSRTRDEPLDNWNYPFYNLGGAGTHFPGMMMTTGRKDGGGGGIGNGKGKGKADAADPQPPMTRGFRFGPMDEATSHIRDSLLTISQNIRMPGLQGLFWDCDEVEWYMRQNGVVVPDLSTDYCPVEVPAPGCAFFQYQEARHREADPGENPPAPAVVTAAGSVSSAAAAVSVFAAAPGMSSTASAAGLDGMNMVEEVTGAWPQQIVNNTNTTAAGGPSGHLLGAVAQPPLGGMAMGSSPDHNLGLPPQLHDNSYASHVPGGGHIPGAPAFGGGAKVVGLNVTKFLNGLTSRAACLGRTPGFRPKDVDAAFWESLVHDGA